MWKVPASNTGGGKIFRTRSDRPWSPPSPLYGGYRVSFPGVKRPGRDVNHPPPSSSEIKERVELYLYSPQYLLGMLRDSLYLYCSVCCVTWWLAKIAKKKMPQCFCKKAAMNTSCRLVKPLPPPKMFNCDIFLWSVMYITVIYGHYFIWQLSVANRVDSFLGAFTKLRKATISFVMSVCPHGTTRLPLDGYWWNLIFETFFENLSRKFKFH